MSDLPSQVREGLLALGRLSGGLEIIDEARRALPDRTLRSGRRLDELEVWRSAVEPTLYRWTSPICMAIATTLA